jgi:hypothetical protein
VVAVAVQSSARLDAHLYHAKNFNFPACRSKARQFNGGAAPLYLFSYVRTKMELHMVRAVANSAILEIARK